MAMVCCLACRSQPTIFISASFVPSLLVGYRKVYSVRCEADVVMTSATFRSAHQVDPFDRLGVPRACRRRKHIRSQTGFLPAHFKTGPGLVIAYWTRGPGDF